VWATGSDATSTLRCTREWFWSGEMAKSDREKRLQMDLDRLQAARIVLVWEGAKE
jgi:hypothetical protein